MTSDGENDDSNEDASVLRRVDDASCLAAMSTSAWHSDNLLQRRDNRRRHEEFDGQERRVEKTERQVVSAKEGWMAEQVFIHWRKEVDPSQQNRMFHTDADSQRGRLRRKVHLKSHLRASLAKDAALVKEQSCPDRKSTRLNSSHG